MDELEAIALLRQMRTFANDLDHLAALDHAIATIERVAASPVGTVDSCLFDGYERPAWVVVDDRAAVPLNEPRRVRLVPDPQPDGQEG